jgi:serpin B
MSNQFMPNHDPTPAVGKAGGSQRSTDMAEVVESCNRFAVDLLAKLASEPGNLFFSPSSIATALAMTLAGARQETAEELRKVLHLTLPEHMFHEGFLELRKVSRTGSVELRSANRLWGQRGYHFLPDFLEITERCYRARFAEVDFRTAAEEARQRINAWVEDQTARKIRDLISPEVLTPLTRLVLTNAIYFKGSWEHEFDEVNTHEEAFWTAPGVSHSVAMMLQMAELRYGEIDGLQVLELPYRSRSIEWRPTKHGDIQGMEPVEIPGSGSDLVLSILLPRGNPGLREIERRFTTAHLQEWTNLRTCLVEASIPKFRIESGFLLNEALESLGMRKAFLVEEADFSRVSDDPEGLFLSAALHKAFVDVNEKGTEAAAATAVALAGRGRMEPQQPRIFRADHPFLFLIRDRATRLSYFVGRVANPAAAR